MTALANKDRTVLELISQEGAMTRSEIRESISQKGSKAFQAKLDTTEPQLEAQNAIDEQINNLINQSLLSSKPLGSGPEGEVISVSEQGLRALSLLISFLHTRRALGIVAMALPIVLLLGNLLFGDHGIQSSISAYYYTGMRNIFVGALCAIAVFLLSYRGYERDYRWTYIAGFFVLLVALFPTTPDILSPTPQDKLIGNLHFVFAAISFSALAGICFWVFTKTDLSEEELNDDSQKGKRSRNRVYRACGWVIVACILLIAIVSLLLTSTPVMQIKPVFLLEFFALLAFGFSWILKSNWNIKFLKFLQDST
jgi:hypothetical protein